MGAGQLWQAGLVPAPQPTPEPQPMLTPLTDRGDLPGADDRPGRRGRRPRSPRRRGRPAALGRVPDPGRRAGLRDRHRLGRRGTGCSAARGRPSCIRSASSRGPAPAPATPGDLLFHMRANRLDLCFEFASQVMNRLARGGDRGRRGARLPVLRRARPDGLRGRHREPRRAGRSRKPSWSAPRTRTSPAAATSSCRSTCTTWTAGTRCRSRSRNGRSAGTKLADIEMPDEVKAAELARGAEHDRRTPDGKERQILRDNMPFGSVGRRRVRHLLHRVRRHAQRHRADAARTCSSATRRATRPDSGLLHRRHRHPVLRADRGLPRRPARRPGRPRPRPLTPTPADHRRHPAPVPAPATVRSAIGSLRRSTPP